MKSIVVHVFFPVNNQAFDFVSENRAESQSRSESFLTTHQVCFRFCNFGRVRVVLHRIVAKVHPPNLQLKTYYSALATHCIPFQLPSWRHVARIIAWFCHNSSSSDILQKLASKWLTFRPKITRCLEIPRNMCLVFLFCSVFMFSFLGCFVVCWSYSSTLWHQRKSNNDKKKHINKLMGKHNPSQEAYTPTAWHSAASMPSSSTMAITMFVPRSHPTDELWARRVPIWDKYNYKYSGNSRALHYLSKPSKTS